MYWFYLADIPKKKIFLNQEESRHITKVLRYGIGDTVYLNDGKGSVYQCIIKFIDKKGCELESIAVKHHPQKEYRIHIAIAPTKNNSRFEWFLEKATEIGIDQITPIYSKHSERRKIQSPRLNKVLIGALKQSCQAYLPKLNEPMCFNDFIVNSGTNDSDMFIAAFHEENQELSSIYQRGEDATILIGPEGDFDKTEMDLALSLGVARVNLGKSRLRTETAGIVACHTISLINQ